MPKCGKAQICQNVVKPGYAKTFPKCPRKKTRKHRLKTSFSRNNDASTLVEEEEEKEEEVVVVVWWAVLMVPIRLGDVLSVDFSRNLVKFSDEKKTGYGPTDRPTDRQTDRPTDTPSYRDAWREE